MATFTYRIQLRRDSAADWTSNDPTLAAAELGFESDTGKLKIGDGSTAWSSLLYFPVDTDGQVYLLDDKKAFFGTGSDGEIYSSSDDLYIRNITSDKDVIFSVNDGGSQQETHRLIGSSQIVMFATGTKLTTGAVTAPNTDKGGLTLDQNTGTNRIFECKTSNCAHGLTSVDQTDTYFSIHLLAGSGAGVWLRGISDSTAKSAMAFSAYCEGTAGTATNENGIILFDIYQHDGVDTTSAVADAGNMLSVANAGTKRFFVKGNGDILYDGSAAAYDSEDDILLSGTLSRKMAGKESAYEPYAERLTKIGVMENGFISRKKLDQLTLGTFGQFWNVLRKIGEKFEISEDELLIMAKDYT